MPAMTADPGVTLTADHLIQLRAGAMSGARSRARSRARAITALPGSFVVKRRGAGQEIADIRAYVAGDDIRHLDRGSTARTGQLHMRVFQEERDRVTILVADFRPGMLWGTERALLSVAGAEALAILGWRAVDEGGRVGLLALTAQGPVVIRARGRATGMLRVIGGLVRAHAQALEAGIAPRPPELDQALAGLDRIAGPGAEIVLASNFEDTGPGLYDLLAQLDRRRHLRVLHVADGQSAALPPGTYPLGFRDGGAALARVGKGSGAVADPGRSRLAMVPDQVPQVAIDAGSAPDIIRRDLAAP